MLFLRETGEEGVMNIGFIGYRNSGKSTVSKLLKKAVKRKVINTDQKIRDYCKMDIPLIIDKYGWDIFRFIEGVVLENCLSLNEVILDLGGGVILNKKAMEAIHKNTFLIYLDCSTDSLIKRARENYYRPALTNLDLDEEIRTVAEQRRPVYSRYADLTVNTDLMSAEECRAVILNSLEGMNVLEGKEKIYSGEGILCVSSF